MRHGIISTIALLLASAAVQAQPRNALECPAFEKKGEDYIVVKDTALILEGERFELKQGQTIEPGFMIIGSERLTVIIDRTCANVQPAQPSPGG
jgi:hypothetical protein